MCPPDRLEETQHTSKLWYWFTVILASAATISVFASVYFSSIADIADFLNRIRTVLGVSLVLFLPGFALTKAIYPDSSSKETELEKNLEIKERLALSVGMSLIITPGILLVLNFTPFGITTTPVTLSLFFVTLIFASIGMRRESKKTNKIPLFVGKENTFNNKLHTETSAN
jgi:uncharacterized membrane protein